MTWQCSTGLMTASKAWDIELALEASNWSADEMLAVAEGMARNVAQLRWMAFLRLGLLEGCGNCATLPIAIGMPMPEPVRVLQN